MSTADWNMERDSAPHPRAPQGLPTVAPAGLIVRISSRRGMTLAELLIVLAILAITSVVALQAVTPLMDQARVDSTISTLNSISSAIVSSNSASVSGFLADTGSLPTSVADLLVQPPLLQASTVLGVKSITLSTNNSWTVIFDSPAAAGTTYLCTLPSGWRGPYLTTPTAGGFLGAVPNITDGWGYSLTADALLGNNPYWPGVIAVANNIVTVSSPGSSGSSASDSTVLTGVLSSYVPLTAYTAGTIAGQMTGASTTANYIVLVTPAPGGVNVFCAPGQTSYTITSSLVAAGASVDAFTGTSVPLYVGPAALIPVTSTQTSIKSHAALSTGTATNIVIRPGSMSVNVSF